MLKEERFDLHCHTSCSDGSMSPKELLVHAKEMGLSGLSITDHDGVEAYLSAIPIAKEIGLLLGSGVEFSTVNLGESIHVLGYDCDIDSPQMGAFCARHVKRREERNLHILEKLRKQGMEIDEEILEQEGGCYSIGRPHIAVALLRKGYVQSIQEAFSRFIGDGMSCYHSGNPISTDETIALIKECGGKAFLAHPHLIRSPSQISHLLNKPFDGLECYYSRFHPGQEQRWVRTAKKKGWLVSGGSDFHGIIKPNVHLGCSWIGRERFEQIFEQNRWE